MTVCVIFGMDYILDSSCQCGVGLGSYAGLRNMACMLIHHKDFVRKTTKDSAG